MVSRLTYSGMDGHAAEAFGRVDHTAGFFLKGYVGVGILLNGNLQDEDFFPSPIPYSSTSSKQNDSTLAYASIDFGYSFIRRPGLRIGAFVGYHYLDETLNAFGCAQDAGNTAICSPALPETWKVITQSNHWNSLRVGLDARIALGAGFSLNLDAAYLPYVKLNGSDTHWLRIGANPGDFTGPIPENGTGTGYQLEASIAYAVNPNVSVGMGARYWRMETSGNTQFDGHVVGVQCLSPAGRLESGKLRRLLAGLVQIRPLSHRGVFLI